MTQKRSGFELIESFHLAYALATLRDLGIDEAMREPRLPDALAQQFGLDRAVLNGVLCYLAATTDLIVCEDHNFRLSETYDHYAGFLIDQYIGAYGNNSAHLKAVLEQPECSGDWVDRNKHAQAFEKLGRPGVALLPGLISQLELKNVLDLGCGPGSLLIELANSDPEFCGWGVDASSNMIERANSNSKELDLQDRLVFYHGDALDFHQFIPQPAIEKVQTVVAASLLNELFAGTGEAAVSFLKELRRALPGRTLLVSDYYGCLGYPDSRWFKETALHDYVQLISGQGIPPPNLEAWADIYSAAECNLVHALEDDKVSGFVHLVRL